MKCWAEAARLVLRRWKDWILVAAFLTGAGAVALLWLAAPLATGMHIVLNAAYVLWAAAFLWYSLWLAKRRFAPEGIRLRRVLVRPDLWGTVALFAAGGLLLPWGLLMWVPGFASLGAQAASAMIRSLLAWALFTGGLCWLVACLGVFSKEES
ncbi:MAG: hypothetical protein ACOYX1_04825 [Acidobacteriota bacterium]